ncbi:MAG: ribosome silencing factor [Chloroflexi bacterium]|nr:ribosome silencing factor [Chloroflexota bacterium]
MNALEDKKGEDILLLDIQGLASFADYFVICSGTSDRMLRALAEGAQEQVKKQHQLASRIEGEAREGWLLVDFGDVILHCFSPDRRDYYRLEELWSQGKIVLRLQ